MSATAVVGLEPEVVTPWIRGLGLGAQAPLSCEGVPRAEAIL